MSPVEDGWSVVGPPVESLLPAGVASVEVVVGRPDEVLSLPVCAVLGAVEVVVLVAPDSARKRSVQPRLGFVDGVRLRKWEDQQRRSIPMLPASKGSPAEVSPSLPETGSVPFVSLLMVSVPVLLVSLVFSLVVVLLLSPQMALAAVLAIEFIVSIVGQLWRCGWEKLLWKSDVIAGRSG